MDFTLLAILFALGAMQDSSANFLSVQKVLGQPTAVCFTLPWPSWSRMTVTSWGSRITAVLNTSLKILAVNDIFENFQNCEVRSLCIWKVLWDLVTKNSRVSAKHHTFFVNLSSPRVKSTMVSSSKGILWNLHPCWGESNCNIKIAAQAMG